MVRSRTAISIAAAIHLSTLAALPTWAATDPANRLLDEQRSEARRARLERAPVSTGAPETPALDTRPSDVTEPGPVILAPSIEVTTHQLISLEQLDALLAPFLHLDIGEARLELLIRQLNARLVEAGWVTSRAQVKRIDRVQRRIEIELIPGRVGVVHAPGMTERSLARALPFSPGDVLALDALEQGAQQINRLRMYDARVRILPGNDVGTSRLDIHLDKGRPWRFAIGADNLGQRTTGSGRLRIQGHLEDHLGLLEDLQMAYLRSDRSEALLASLAVPDGFNTWSATVSASHSDINLLGLDYVSRTTTLALGFNRVLGLNREGRTAFDLSLLRSRAGRRLGDVRLSTDRTTVLRGALNLLRRSANYQFYAEPALVAGLGALGATRDRPGMADSDTHHQFIKASIDAGLLVLLGQGREYAAQLSAQRSEVSLAGLEQMSLGGMATVRGYNEAAVSGDTGHVLRQELRLAPLEAFGHPLTPYVHADTGTVWLTGGDRHTLSSIGLGLRTNTGHLIGEAVLSMPLHHAEYNNDGHWRIHAQVAYEF